MKKVLIPFLFLALIVPVYAQVLEVSKVGIANSVQDFFGVQYVVEGEYIVVAVEVKNTGNTPIYNELFELTFIKPNFTSVTYRTGLINKTIGVGEVARFIIKTNVSADTVGGWVVHVKMYTVIHRTPIKLAEARTSFEVSEKPTASITAVQVAGMFAASGLTIGGVLAINRFL